MLPQTQQYCSTIIEITSATVIYRNDHHSNTKNVTFFGIGLDGGQIFKSRITGTFVYNVPFSHVQTKTFLTTDSSADSATALGTACLSQTCQLVYPQLKNKSSCDDPQQIHKRALYKSVTNSQLRPVCSFTPLYCHEREQERGELHKVQQDGSSHFETIKQVEVEMTNLHEFLNDLPGFFELACLSFLVLQISHQTVFFHEKS